MDSSYLRIIHTFVFISLKSYVNMKTKALLPVLVFFLASLAGCNSSSPKSLVTNDGSVRIIESPDGPLYICDLKTAGDTVDIPLSELVEDCRIVRFETTDEALFNAWWIEVSDNYICVRQESNVVKLYGKDGKFLCNVGAMGNGPGEYSMTVYDEIIDEKGGHIFFSPFYGKKIMMYGLDGKWIKDINLPGQINKPKIEINADGTLSVVHMPFEEGTPIAFRMDTDGNILSQVPARDYMLAGSFDGEIFSYRNTGTFDFFYTGIDTTFTYDAAANKLIPRFTMNFPGFTLKPIHIYTELPDHVLVHYYTWDKGRVMPGGNIWVDKKKMSSSQYRLVNDFYGNLPIPNPNSRFNKGRFIFNVEPAVLQEMIEAHLVSGKCPDRDKTKLKELAATLHENDNNLLFVGKLKHDK